MTISLQVLVVDDEPDVAESFGMLLEQIGHEVETADGGRGALDLLDNWRADIAFIDLGMPQMDGFELADRLRDGDFPTPELVALTGYGGLDDRDKAREHGFNRHIVKPPDPDEIISILDAVKSNVSRGSRR